MIDLLTSVEIYYCSKNRFLNGWYILLNDFQTLSSFLSHIINGYACVYKIYYQIVVCFLFYEFLNADIKKRLWTLGNLYSGMKNEYDILNNNIKRWRSRSFWMICTNWWIFMLLAWWAILLVILYTVVLRHIFSEIGHYRFCLCSFISMCA